MLSIHMGLHIIYSITNMSTSRLLIKKKTYIFFLVRSGRLRSGHGTKCLETIRTTCQLQHQRQAAQRWCNLFPRFVFLPITQTPFQSWANDLCRSPYLVPAPCAWLFQVIPSHYGTIDSCRTTLKYSPEISGFYPTLVKFY